MEMYRRTYAEINLDSLAHNIELLQRSFPNVSFFCPMIKANAYGHGDVQLGLFLESLGVKHLGVCLIEEGLLLRSFGVKAEILVFRGFDKEGARIIVQNNMTPVVSTWDHLEHLESLDLKSPVSIHLKFDTGMNRLGFKVNEAQKLFDRLWQNKKIRLKALATHLFSGEDALSDSLRSSEQLRSFHAVSMLFKPFGVFCHALNSAGTAALMNLNQTPGDHNAHPLMLQNWGLRPGLMIYGFNPLPQSQNFGLKPVMALKSHVNSYRLLEVGETVSYNGTWQASRPSIIAVIPIGYADGYHRILSNKSSVLFMGHRVPVVGKICMDYLMIDVTDVIKAEDIDKYKNQEVTLFGYDSDNNFISPKELSEYAQTIIWEILTSVGERVPRIYSGDRARAFKVELDRGDKE